jgi:hypothetical protein
MSSGIHWISKDCGRATLRNGAEHFRGSRCQYPLPLYSVGARDDCTPVVYGATYQAIITSFNQTLKDLCLKLAHFVLTNNYVECEELGDASYHQIIGTLTPAVGKIDAGGFNFSLLGF